MLASPLPPQNIFSSVSEESHSQYRPARDREAFNKLLPPSIEFVEGSSSDCLAIPAQKYEPINASPKFSKMEIHDPPTPTPTTHLPTKHVPPSSRPKIASLYPHHIDVTWPETCTRGNGIFNMGNTCFINSTLQCLLHTPPLLRMLLPHEKDTCRANNFCMICSMRTVAVQSYKRNLIFSPSTILNYLKFIAKDMRRGRQEDSHEFLRYAVDALQKSCLVGFPQKIDPKLAETTWVHKIFGGRLRSRVTCLNCGHNSDTFDRILDLSVDIHEVESLKMALRKFVTIEYLNGTDKYKCEKCKSHVNAEKQFTIDEAPPVLTVHLKRFSPTGRKIGHQISYDEILKLQPYMSECRHGPIYTLYGVVCHVGGGPNSGHYHAFVKSRLNQWWHMNDETVCMIDGPPLNKKSAYMLFYLRTKDQEFVAAINGGTARPKIPVVTSMKKRKEREREPVPAIQEAEEDTGIKVSRPSPDPAVPLSIPKIDNSSVEQTHMQAVDPQAALIKKKIEAASVSKRSLKKLDMNCSSTGESPDVQEKPSSSLTHQNSSSLMGDPIPPLHFYGPNNRKRKSRDDDLDTRPHATIHARSNGYSTSYLNPYAKHARSRNKPKPV